MNDQIQTELINKLADKLGTTSEHAWQILVDQAHVNAATGALISTILIIVLVWLFLYIRYKTTVRVSDYGCRVPPSWNGDKVNLMWGIFNIYAIVVFFITLCVIETAITVIYNPEYWALQQLLDTIK